jgi:hypothetical protein
MAFTDQLLEEILRRPDGVEQLQCIITILARVESKIDKLMSSTNQSAANLQAGIDAIETDIAKLGPSISSEITDVQAEIAADLAQNGVPSALVDAQTARLADLDTRVQAMLAQTTAADPGAQPTPPAATANVKK